MKVFNQRKKEKRTKNDFYPTPKIAMDMLFSSPIISNVIGGGLIHEPASGEGDISKYLENKGFKVISSDISKSDKTYGTKEIDFLTNHVFFENINTIMTNPPYSLGEEFVRRSLYLAKEKVILLMRLSFLESQSRYQLFKDHKPYAVIVLSRRLPHYYDGKWDESGQFSHAWFIWDKTKKFDNTIIDWVI